MNLRNLAKPAQLAQPAPDALPHALSGPAARRPGGCARWVGAGLCGLLSLALFGCEGEGTGQVSGTLFVRGCADYDPTDVGSHDVPSPLPSFSLDPQYFFAEVELSTRRIPSEDPPGVTRMHLRLQKTSHKIERTDGFELFIYDLDGLPRLQAEALARGESGVPIIPAALDQLQFPPPPAPDSTVRAALRLSGTCPYPLVAPLPRGYVRFTELGSQPGDIVAGEFAVTLEDLRALREQVTNPLRIDVGGALTGSFRFPIRTGPAAGAL